MAERRMFAKTIVLSDAFLDMPLSARCLYFTLGMVADDDGFVNNPKSIMRQCGAQEDDMKILIAKKFVLAFDNGIIVVKHWRINNYLRNDRYTETKYKEERSTLSLDENGAYQISSAELGIPCGIPDGIPSNADTQYGETQVRLGKDSIGKDNITVSNETVRCSRNDVKRVIESWNQSGFKPVTKITSDSSRGGMLRKRITDYGVETVLQAIERAKGSDYLHGNNANGWEMDFGWFVRPNNFPKVLEGKYDNRTPYNKIVELKPQSRQACANDIVEYPKGSGQYRPYWEVPGYDGK